MSFFPRTSAQLNAAEMAMIQPAKMSAEQFKKEGRAALENVEKSHVRFQAFVTEFKLRHKEFGASLDIASENVFGVAWSSIRSRLCRIRDSGVALCNGFSIEEDKKDSLAQVARLPDPVASKPTPKPQPQGPDSEEPPPTPRIRTESGKAKRDLAIWGELRELIGKSGNRASSLNDQCPNPQRKEKLLAILDEARAELDAWWEETK